MIKNSGHTLVDRFCRFTVIGVCMVVAVAVAVVVVVVVFIVVCLVVSLLFVRL